MCYRLESSMTCIRAGVSAVGRARKDEVKRTRTVAGWLRGQYPDAEERITWDDLWMNFALMIGRRSRCVRDQIGAVIVSADNRILGAGYNGPAAGMTLEGSCKNWCPRAISGECGEKLDPEYNDCFSLHAEINALLRTDTSGKSMQGASIYISSSMCWQCSGMVANSGISRAVFQIMPFKHRHRRPDAVVDFLQECGVEVVVMNNTLSAYRAIFVDEYGYGPHECYFCHVSMARIEVIHHKDSDHSNNDISNLAASHISCHTQYHNASSPTQWKGAAPRYSVTTEWTRRKPILQCRSCPLETTPGWLKRHAEMTGHDGSAYTEWRADEDLRITVEKANEKICPGCGQIFKSKSGVKQHRSWTGCGGYYDNDRAPDWAERKGKMSESAQNRGSNSDEEVDDDDK